MSSLKPKDEIEKAPATPVVPLLYFANFQSTVTTAATLSQATVPTPAVCLTHTEQHTSTDYFSTSELFQERCAKKHYNSEQAGCQCLSVLIRP
ncbi:MAG: hypothetical protein NTX48_00730 [Planctomycetales bacterium]|nr:hypothetical protein [Planctomycetales bacterium]